MVAGHTLKKGAIKVSPKLVLDGSLEKAYFWSPDTAPATRSGHQPNRLGFLPVLQLALWAQVTISTLLEGNEAFVAAKHQTLPSPKESEGVLVILAALRLPKPSAWPAPCKRKSEGN